MAATPASTTPAARPRHPAWTAPTTPAAGSASSTGAQSAVRTASTTPGSVVTSPSASPTGSFPSGGPGPSATVPARPDPGAARPAPNCPVLVSTARIRLPWTWRARAQGRPARPRTVATRRRLASTRRRSSPTARPRLRVAYGGAEDPPARPVKAATTPASSRSSATSTGGQAGSAPATSGESGRQTSPADRVRSPGAAGSPGPSRSRAAAAGAVRPPGAGRSHGACPGARRSPVIWAALPSRAVPAAAAGSSGGCWSALEEGGDVQLVVIAVVAGTAFGLAPLRLPPFGVSPLGRGRGRRDRPGDPAVGGPAVGGPPHARGRPDRLVLRRPGALSAHGVGVDLLGGPVEPGRDHRDPDLVPEGVVDHGPEDDVGVGVGGRSDHLGGLVDLEQAQVGAAGDVEEYAPGPVDRRLQQGRGDGLLGRGHGPVLAAGLADAHQRRAGLAHGRPHVGEVEVDQPGDGDQVGDPLHALEQHLVGQLERVQHRGGALGHLEQAVVGDDDEGVDLLLEALDALVGLGRAALALEGER